MCDPKETARRTWPRKNLANLRAKRTIVRRKCPREFLGLLGCLFLFSRFIYGHSRLSEREITRSLLRSVTCKTTFCNTTFTNDVIVKFYSYFLYSSTVLVSWWRTPNSRETRPQSRRCWKSCFSSARNSTLVTTFIALVTQHTSRDWRYVTT